jgi:glycosyltransferase involved in cell wall biosynthesis
MISVVIPVVDNYDLTDQLLNDIVNNTFYPAEIILIDNNSNDNIYDLVKKYNKLNIVYIRNHKNIGVNASWNLGRELANYEYIVILNNDIRINKQFFEKIITVMREDYSIALCSATITNDLNELYININPVSIDYQFSILGNAYILTKTASKQIGPIPRELFTFFGDNYIISRIDQLGLKTAIMKNNNIFHHDHKTLYYLKTKEDIVKEYYIESHIYRKIRQEFNLKEFKWDDKTNYFDGSIFIKMLDFYKETEHVNLLKEFFKLLKIDTYVELGVKNGFTFNNLSPYVKRAVGVDVLPMPKVNVSPQVQLFQMTTEEFSKVWNEPIDFLFIDADHKKESVLNDFNMFSKFVKENTGIIAIHDTYPVYSELLDPMFCNNAWEAAWEIRNNPDYKEFEFFTIPGPFAGLTLLRKSKKPLGWM